MPKVTDNYLGTYCFVPKHRLEEYFEGHERPQDLIIDEEGE